MHLPQGQDEMRCVVVVATGLLVVALAGCGSKSGEAGRGPSRVERCVDRFFDHVRPEDLATTGTEGARRYIRVTYCERFESRGWVYDDGALSIAAQRWLEDAGSESCGSDHSETAPCKELEPRDEPEVIDCAMLRQVRRSEVRAYIQQLPRDVVCDDGTPVEQLGAR